MKHQLSNEMSEVDKAIVKIMAYSKAIPKEAERPLQKVCEELGVTFIQ
jgi:hypothetical protein